MKVIWSALPALLCVGLFVTEGHAGDRGAGQKQPASADSVKTHGVRPSALARATRDVRKGLPVVVHVLVALCDRSQLACGGHGLGNPASLRTNLYWGALFGVQRFFGEQYGYQPLPQPSTLDKRGKPGSEGILTRAVYRRWVDGARWGVRGRQVEQLTVVDAVHGAYIRRAALRFHRVASLGERLRITDGERTRDVSVAAVGYAGHNVMMDGLTFPTPDPREARQPLPSFVLACMSDNFFSTPLRAAGSTPLLTTRAYMAPEGYAVEAAVRALAENRSATELRTKVVSAYAKWQRLSFKAASRLFAPAAM